MVIFQYSIEIIYSLYLYSIVLWADLSIFYWNHPHCSWCWSNTHRPICLSIFYWNHRIFCWPGDLSTSLLIFQYSIEIIPYEVTHSLLKRLPAPLSIFYWNHQKITFVVNKTADFVSLSIFYWNHPHQLHLCQNFHYHSPFNILLKSSIVTVGAYMFALVGRPFQYSIEIIVWFCGIEWFHGLRA